MIYLRAMGGASSIARLRPLLFYVPDYISFVRKLKRKSFQKQNNYSRNCSYKEMALYFLPRITVMRPKGISDLSETNRDGVATMFLKIRIAEKRFPK